jgi:hypothetical protein
MIANKITDGCDGRNHRLVKRLQFHKSVEILFVSILDLGLISEKQYLNY